MKYVHRGFSTRSTQLLSQFKTNHKDGTLPLSPNDHHRNNIETIHTFVGHLGLVEHGLGLGLAVGVGVFVRVIESAEATVG